MEPVSSYAAPIGAQVFAIERRNHSKTGVYEDLCVRVPVDTTIAVDKMKKAEKGFKFERFDVFIQLLGSSWGHQGSKDKIKPGAARMDGLSFDSARPNRSLCSTSQTRQIAAEPSRPRRIQPSLPPSEIRCGIRNRPEFQTFSLSFPSSGRPGFPRLSENPRRAEKTGSNLPGRESKDPGPLDSAQNVRTGCGHVLWPGRYSVMSNAAHRLQYELAVSCDDCSSPQKPAGRGNEETTQ